jgi:hypothetical protein
MNEHSNEWIPWHWDQWQETLKASRKKERLRVNKEKEWPKAKKKEKWSRRNTMNEQGRGVTKSKHEEQKEIIRKRSIGTKGLTKSWAQLT